MRHSPTILLPLLALAACGGGGTNQASDFDLPGGGFDRARFRSATMDYCRNQLQRRPEIPAGAREVLCDCAATQLMEANDEAALRAMVRDQGLATRKNDEAIAQCTAMAGSGDGEELPPPIEALPPPVTGPSTGETADGPDPGGGASAPGGARARARANLGSYLSADDYPAAALRNNEQGRVTFTLDISPEGRVTNCVVEETSGSASLDSTTCRIMRSRARYAPARNPRGMAVADRDRAVVRWQLPSG